MAAEDALQKPGWITPTLLGLSTLVVFAHVVLRDDYHTATAGAFAGVLGAITLSAWWRFVKVQPDRFPTLEAGLLYQYFHYGLSITVPPLQLGIWGITPSAEAHESATLLALACFTATIGGAALGFVALPQPTRSRLIPDISKERLMRGATIYVPIAALGVVLILVAPVLITAGVGTIAVVFSGGPLAVIATFAYLDTPSLRHLIQLIAAVALIIVSTLISSMLSYSILPLAIVCMIWLKLRGRLPLAIGAALLLVAIVLQPVKGYYRTMRNTGSSAKVSAIDAWQEAFAQHADSGQERAGGGGGTEAIRSRLSELSTLAYTMQLVPAMIPHTGGMAYAIIPPALIPRLLWPDKPNMSREGTESFTIALGLQTAEWGETSAMALSIPPHGYLEHGWGGAIAWSLMVGFAHALVRALFGFDRSGQIVTAILTAHLIFAYDGGLVPFVTGLIHWLVYGVAIAWMLYAMGYRGGQMHPRASNSERSPAWHWRSRGLR